jgi:drug/metabolite transporter (DMT)-like permease
MQHNARFTTLLGLIAMVLIWGSFPIAVKFGTQNVPPLFLSSARFLLASILMMVLLWTQRKKVPLTFRQHMQIALISLLMIGIPSSIYFAAAPYAAPGALTVMWAPSPIFTALFTMGSASEVRGWRLPVSLLVGLLGVLLVMLGYIPFLPGSTALLSGGSSVALIAELAVFASSAVYGLGMRVSKRYDLNVPVMVLTTWQMCYSGLFMALMGLLFERDYAFNPTWITLGSLLYLAVFCSCIGFFLLFWLIRRIGAIRTSYTDFIIPGVTLVLSALLLNESMTFAKIIGFALVMLGCVLVQI